MWHVPCVPAYGLSCCPNALWYPGASYCNVRLADESIEIFRVSCSSDDSYRSSAVSVPISFNFIAHLLDLKYFYGN